MNDKQKDVKYLNRDFDTLLKSLVDYTKYYYPDSFNDFSPASPAMILLQLMSYVGDVLNFYIDKQTKQSILYYATQKQSIYDIAQSYGYRIKTAIPASVQVTIRCLVKHDNNKTLVQYAPILAPGTIVKSADIPNSNFVILEQINFTNVTPNEILDTTDKGDQYKILTKKVYAYSVIEKTINLNVGKDVKENLKLYLPDTNIVKIISVVDSGNVQWHQVLNLANNRVADDSIEYVSGVRKLSYKITNKRYKKLVDINDRTYLYFGSKNKSTENVSVGFDASSLIMNNTYGQVPLDTTLKVTYLVSNNVVVPRNKIDTLVSYENYNNINDMSLQFLDVFNQASSIGGSGVETLEQIKQNALATINTQNRLVTFEDYINTIKIMPAQYGSIYKSYVYRNMNGGTIQLWLMGRNGEGHLIALSPQIKENLGQFLQQYRILGDRLLIRDAKIINVSCEFKISSDVRYSKKEVLYRSIMAIKNYMNIQNFDIGTPINVKQMKNVLLSTQGVTNVIFLKMYNKFNQSGFYSNIKYDMNNAYDQSQDMYFTSHTPSIFQLKYPDKDIVGSII